MTTAQLDEVGWLVDQGVTSFKFYMFYKALTLSADSTKGKEYTMADTYDFGHLYELMERVAYEAKQRGIRISLSLHCENPELIRVFIDRVKRDNFKALEAYSKGRPPLTEMLSIEEAGVLTKATDCPVNLLHLSSKDAITTAIDLRRRHINLDMLLEVTLHHLALNYEELEGINAKVNPPIRAKEDQAALWKALVSGEVDTVVSDHACCMEEMKGDELWAALPGFGGTSLLYPVLLSEGVRKKGLSLLREWSWPRPTRRRSMVSSRARARSLWAVMPTWRCATSKRHRRSVSKDRIPRRTTTHSRDSPLLAGR